jgi:tripartite ATP-independent transporter DctM subunit
MGLTILMLIFGVGVVVGMPVAFAMGIAAASAFWYEGFPMLITFQRATAGVTVFSLLAIPFFVFAGEIMLHGGIARRLVKLASALVGHFRGGLAMVNIFSSMLFGGISGSAVAHISAPGSLLVPVMKERGYRPDFAVNVTVTSSIAGIVIPPSHNMIILAVAAGAAFPCPSSFLRA